MVSHMKTTIDLADSLLSRAKAEAAREGRTLKDVVEQAVRQYLDAKKKAGVRPFRLRRCSFKGRGLKPGIAEGKWETIRDLIYRS